VRAAVELVAVEFLPEGRVDHQQRLGIDQRVRELAHQAFGHVFDLDEPARRARGEDRIAQVGHQLGEGDGKALVVAFGHREEVPELHLHEPLEMAKRGNDFGQIAIAEGRDHRVGQQPHILVTVEILHPREHLVPRAGDLRNGVMAGCSGPGDRDEELVHPGLEQPVGIPGPRQVHTVRLDADPLETGSAGGAGEIGQVGSQGDLGAGQDETAPAAMYALLLKHLVEKRRGGRLQPVHRALDHAVHASEVAAKFHRHADVVVVIAQRQPLARRDGLGRGHAGAHAGQIERLARLQRGVGAEAVRGSHRRFPWCIGPRPRAWPPNRSRYRRADARSGAGWCGKTR